MKKRGFTLVEIMAAIVILGLIVLVTYPLISKIMVTNKRNLYNEQIHSLEDLARRWAVNNDLLLPNEKDDVYKLYLTQLYDEDYVEKEDMINPLTNEQLKGCIVIKLNDSLNKYMYTYKEDCN